MPTVSLDLPADLVAHISQENPAQEAALLIALELFRQRKISLGRAAQLCNTPLAAFIEYASSHGVPPISYGEQQWEEDRRTIERLGL